MTSEELLLLLDDPAVAARIQQIAGAVSAPASPPGETERLKKQLKKLSRALEESREQVFSLQQENDTLRTELEQANRSIQELLTENF